jgi:ribokinase
VIAQGMERLPGGKGANQAAAAARIGAATCLLGAVGDDEAGMDARQAG